MRGFRSAYPLMVAGFFLWIFGVIQGVALSFNRYSFTLMLVGQLPLLLFCMITLLREFMKDE